MKGIREGALFLWLFWNCPAGGVKARGRCGNGDSELAKEYLPELNSGITADELLIRNDTKVKWRCCKCGYEWITTIGHRAKRGTGCPRCNGKKTSQSKMKAVVCVETGKIYESIMSAGRDVKRTDGAICQALRNESRTCAGYHWRYLDE